jgi:hypothetical protein
MPRLFCVARLKTESSFPLNEQTLSVPTPIVDIGFGSVIVCGKWLGISNQQFLCSQQFVFGSPTCFGNGIV